MPGKSNKNRVVLARQAPVFTGALPSINTTASRFQVIRFAGAPTVNTSINRGALLSLVCANVSGAATNMVPIYTAVRVVGIRCYIPGNTGTTARSPSLQFTWVGNEGPGTDFSWTNTGTLGFRSPLIRPPKNSRCGHWSRAGAASAGVAPVADLTEVLFQLNKNAEDDTADFVYIDLHLELKTDGNSPALITMTAGPSIGIVYNALDCITPSSGSVGEWKMLPVNVLRSYGSAPAAFARSGG